MLNFKNYIKEEIFSENSYQENFVGKYFDIIQKSVEKLNWKISLATQKEKKDEGIDFWVKKIGTHNSNIGIKLKNVLKFEVIRPYYEDLKKQFLLKKKIDFNGIDMQSKSIYICLIDNLKEKIYFCKTEEIKENCKKLTLKLFEEFISTGNNCSFTNSSGTVYLQEDSNYEIKKNLRGKTNKICCTLNLDSLIWKKEIEKLK